MYGCSIMNAYTHLQQRWVHHAFRTHPRCSGRLAQGWLQTVQVPNEIACVTAQQIPTISAHLTPGVVHVCFGCYLVERGDTARLRTLRLHDVQCWGQDQ